MDLAVSVVTRRKMTWSFFVFEVLGWAMVAPLLSHDYDYDLFASLWQFIKIKNLNTTIVQNKEPSSKKYCTHISLFIIVFFAYSPNKFTVCVFQLI